jgi:hypothetical protein
MMKQLLEQNEERLLLPGDNPVPSRTSKGSIPLDSSSLVPTPCGQYGTTQTVGQELAAYYERIVDREYEEHLDWLKADVRAKYEAEYEYRKGELERWRARKVREMCAGLDV